MRVRSILVAALVAAFLFPAFSLLPASAEAQGRSTATARRLFRQGVQALRRDDFATAEDALRRSFEVEARPVTLYNLALAQAGAGHLVASSETYRRFIREATDPRYADYRQDAEGELEGVEARIASLTLEVENLGAGDAIALDDDGLSRAEVGTPLPVDPGAHVATVTRAGEEVAREEFELEEGATQTITLAAPALVAAATPGVVPGPEGALDPDGPEDGDADSGGGLSTWAVVGIVVAALAVAGGATAAILVATASEEEPQMGTLGTFTIR